MNRGSVQNAILVVEWQSDYCYEDCIKFYRTYSLLYRSNQEKDVKTGAHWSRDFIYLSVASKSVR